MDSDVKALAEEFGGEWGEHPQYDLEAWRNEVMEDNTRVGYWEWVHERVEEEEEDEDSDGDPDDSRHSGHSMDDDRLDDD